MCGRKLKSVQNIDRSLEIYFMCFPLFLQSCGLSGYFSCVTIIFIAITFFCQEETFPFIHLIRIMQIQ